MRVVSIIACVCFFNVTALNATTLEYFIKSDSIKPFFTDCQYFPDPSFDLSIKKKYSSQSLSSNNYFVSNFAIDSSRTIYTPSFSSYGDSLLNGIMKINGDNGITLFNQIHEVSINENISHISFYEHLNTFLLLNNYSSLGLLSVKKGLDINWIANLTPYGSIIPRLCDFNQDGIPEVYSGNDVFNGVTGRILFNGQLSEGCSLDAPWCFRKQTVAADLTDAPGLELACGNVVYELNLVNLDSIENNTTNIVMAPLGVPDGFTSVVDLNMDGKLDIVVVRDLGDMGGGKVIVWEPINREVLAEYSGFEKGGVASIGDVDGDCTPEIIVAFKYELVVFKYDGTNKLKRLWTRVTTDTSGFTGSSLFDFNQDGRYEIIYRDETFLKVFDGFSGITLDSFEIHSVTGAEYPIVTDIDDDGQAEILVNGYLPSEPDSVRIFCFESASSPWAPARKIWNQTGYNITNVNDDGTIPQYQQNNAAFFPMDSCGGCKQPYNTFMAQATYRDQNGCPVWPAVDMVTDIIEYTCKDDSVTVAIEIRNQSSNPFKQDSINLGIYYNQDDSPSQFVQREWVKGQSIDTVYISVPSTALNKIKVRVNIPNDTASFTSNIHGLTNVLECDYENNLDSVEIMPCFIEEVCDNGIDDDADGLIDWFDTDCQCEDNNLGIICDLTCQFVPDSIFVSQPIKPRLKWVTDKIGTSTDLSVSAINMYLIDTLLFIKCSDTLNGNILNEICSINFKNGLISHKFKVDTTLFSANSEMLVFNYLSNEYIITIDNNGALLCIENNIVKWKNLNFEFNYPILQNFKAADFNQDGVPEIYFADKIISLETGKLLFEGGLSKGCNYFSTFDTSLCNVTHSYAADLTNSPGLELACGNIVYEISLTNLIDSIGNTFNAIIAPISVRDGFTAVADFDLDGLLDVVVVRSNLDNDGGLWVWNPRLKTIISDIENHSFKGLRGSIPTIYDLNNDCFPEIIISYENMLRVYSYDGNTSLKLLYSISTSDKSGFTGSTVHDLNSDHIPEILYRDETDFKIFNGVTGSIIFQTPIFSATGNEYPIISDVDDDGQAEILVSGGLDSKREVRIFCFESATTPWAPARKIWNQTGYNITNVNDDGTIPQYQQNNAAFFPMDSCGGCNQPYNTFMAQATYRDQNGCPVWPAVDMVTDIIDYICLGDSITLAIEIWNQSANPFKQDSINLGIYYNQDDSPSQFVQRGWVKGQSIDTVYISVPSTALNKIRVRVNIPTNTASFASNIHGLTQVLECDYDNNLDSVEISLASLTLNLGPDITKCQSEVITLIANPEFTSYLWNDLSTDSIYSSSFEGLHYVEATDACGRVYRDTVEFILDAVNDIDLGADIEVCPTKSQNIIISGDFDQVNWIPADQVDCDTCRSVNIVSDTSFQLIVIGQKGSCVSIDTIEITIIPQTIIKDTISICEGDDYTVQDSLLKTAGIYTFDLNDCDSVYQLDLRVIPMLATKDTTMICLGDSIEVGGVWLSEAGIYPFTYPTNAGCDSLVELALLVQDVSASSDEMYICPGDSIQLFGVWQKEADLYTTTFQSIAGCDSLVSITLKQYKDFAFFDTIALCDGDSIQVGGQWVKTEGATAIPLQTVNGCDSIYNVFLSFGSLFMKSEPITICEGDSTLIDTIWVKEAGNYPVTFQNNSGCDSLITYELSVNEILTTKDTFRICKGDSIQINNKWINSAGIYLDTVPDGICYKINTTLIREIPIEVTSSQFTLCPNDSININGTWLTASGEYDFMLTTSFGCDSLFTAAITMLESPSAPELFIDCDALETLAEISANSNWTINWDNGQEGEFATYTTSGMGSVSLTSPPDCEVIYEFDLERLPQINTFPILKDTIVSKGTALEYFLPLWATEWDIIWTTSSTILDTTNTLNYVANSTETITVELVHFNGCAYTMSFTVQVIEEEIAIPNVFSPNGDGTNDTWIIDLSGVQNPETFIFDRWGNLVYKATNSNAMWDGRFNGKLVSPGVYVYMIRYDLQTKRVERSGDITVVR